MPSPFEGVRGSFHSLIVADFDNDGDADIVTAEQEDPSILPSGATPRFFLWTNEGKARNWTPRVILDAGLGGHDIRDADVDGDGDLDIVSKIWRRWDGNANQGRIHLDWLENLSPRKPGK